VVTSVEALELPAGAVYEMGLNEGNRSDVMYVAMRASQLAIDVRCVIDYDCGQYLDEHEYAALRWTDFPAIESYALEEETLNRANLVNFREVLPSAAELMPGLTFALSELYAVRLKHLNLPEPRYSAGLSRQKPSLSEFDVEATVDVGIRPLIAEYPRPGKQDDPRSYAYGHDIAALLLATYGNKLKNTAGLLHRDAVEGALVSAMLAIGTYKTEHLFEGLTAWVAA